MRRRVRQWSKLLALLKHQRTYALVLFAIMLMTAAAEVFGLSLVLPLVSGLMGFQDPTSGFAEYVRAVTHAMPDGHELEGILVVLVIAFLTKALLVVMRRGMTANYALRLRESWSNRIFSHYLHARLEALGGSKHGVLINNVAAEPLKASKGIVQLLELVAKVLMAGSMFCVLLLTDWKMTLSIGALAGCLLYVIKGRSHAYSVKLGQERMALNQGISADAGDGIGALKEVKIYGVERQFQNRLAHKLARFKKIVTKFTILSELPSHLVEPVVVLLLAGLLIFYQYGHGDELTAALPMLAFFMLVAERLFNYASQAITSSMKIASFLPAWRMIHGLVAGTEEEEQAPPGIGISKLDSDIEVCRVHFAYAAHSPVFSGLSLSIPLGKMTAIVGASGVGKTTLVDLVMGLYPVGAGEIRINGRNLREVDLRAWRDRIGYVCQDAHLFHASIEDNILIANPEATRDDVVRAARFANAHEFISAMPRGYETIVGERGTKLSGGQRQRIAIARAVVRDPDVLIFDEATSALDSESERLIRCAVEGLARLKTTIVIAHRMSTIANADFIYELLPEGVAQVTDYDSLRGSILSPEGDALDPAVRTPLFEDRE